MQEKNKVDQKKDYGVIYYLYCKTSKKGYVGQAMNYTSGNKKWGAIGRWNSHVIEATKSRKDHCVILNQAIRKYGSNDFTVTTLGEFPIPELNEQEVVYIKKMNTLTPNGYNLTTGGNKTQMSEISKDKMRMYRTGKKRDMTVCENISKGQIGVRRKTKVRSNPMDNILPKYIVPIRNRTNNSEQIIGYRINAFPVGIEKKKYISFAFAKTKNTKEENYELAIKKLEELKKQYSYIEAKIQETKNENEKLNAQKKMENKYGNLPQYVHPIIKFNHLVGYYVDGLIDSNNKIVPIKYFDTLSCNTKNYNTSLRYIRDFNIKKKNYTFTETIDNTLTNIEKEKEKKKTHTYKRSKLNNLPKYLAYVVVDCEKIGYQINNFPLVSNVMYIKQKFCSKRKTMEEKYKQATKLLESLWQERQEFINNGIYVSPEYYYPEKTSTHEYEKIIKSYEMLIKSTNLTVQNSKPEKGATY